MGIQKSDHNADIQGDQFETWTQIELIDVGHY